MNNKPTTEATRKKISDSLRGNVNGKGRRSTQAIANIRNAKVGSKNPMFGTHHSLEAKAQRSKENAGSNNAMWNGGSIRWFRKQVFERDDYTCQTPKCGFRDKDIMVLDHIKPKSIYPELKYEMNNLQTLCPNCHARKTNKEKKHIIDFKKNNI